MVQIDNAVYILMRDDGRGRDVEIVDVFTDLDFACEICEHYRTDLDESRENHEDYWLEQHFITRHRRLPETIEDFDEINDII